MACRFPLRITLVLLTALSCSAQGFIIHARAQTDHRTAGHTQPGAKQDRKYDAPGASTTIEVYIIQRLATVRVTHIFRNNTSETVAGTYSFPPLPEEALAFRFSAYGGDRVRQGQANVLQESRAEPLQARSERSAAAAATGWSRSQVEVPPGSERRFELNYSQVLDSKDHVVTFVYPLDQLSARLNERPADVDIAFDVRAANAIRAISSPTHRIDLTLDGSSHVIGKLITMAGAAPESFKLVYSIDETDTGGGLDLSVAASSAVDASGAAIAGATVTIRDEQKQVRTVVTDESGRYNAAGLPPGSYTIEVTATGFKATEITNVDVVSGQMASVAVRLEAGSTVEAVTVVPAAPAVDTAASHASASLEAKKLKDLPSLAPVDSLARLLPGTSARSLENLWKQPSVMEKGPELRLWINTGQTRANNYSLDGHDNNDVDGRPAILIDNFDSVDLLHILTTRGSGDVSGSGGSSLNIITRGGTNEFHGSAFDYYLNRRLGALSPFERRSGLDHPPKFKDTIYGGVLGGPIRRDRIFFFGSFQGQTETSQRFADATSAMLTPTPKALESLINRFPNSPTVRDIAGRGPFASPLGAGQIVRSFTVPVLGQPVEFAQVTRIVPLSREAYEAGARIEINATSRDKVGFRYWYDTRGNGHTAGDLSSGFAGDAGSRGQLGGINWNRLLSPLSTNDLTMGFNRGRTSVDTDDTGPYVTVGVHDLSYGQSPLFPESHASTAFNFSDTLSHIAGRHTFKLGGQFRHRRTGFEYLPGKSGAFTYTTFDDFVLDHPAAVVAASGDSHFRFSETHHHSFIDDAWRARENLTLSFGVSYENAAQPLNDLADRIRKRESADSTALFDPSLPLELRTIPRLPRDNNNVAPRLGFAYTPRFRLFGRDLFGRDKTVIRGGVNIFYDATAYRPLAEVATSTPSVLFTVATPDSVAQLPAFPSLRRATPGGDPRDFARTRVAGPFVNPYSLRWHLATSRDLLDRASLEVGYVGARSFGIIRAADGSTDLVEGPIRDFSTSGRSTYHALQSRLNVRFENSLQGGISYTFSKLIDDVPDNAALGPYVVGAVSSVGIPALPSFAQNPADVSTAERALSSLDRRHSLTAHFVWTLPPRRAQNGFIGRLLGGWQTSGIVEVGSGSPYTPLQQLGRYAPDSTALFASVFSNRLGSIRPFAGNPFARAHTVAFSNAANLYYRFFSNPDGSVFQSSTGFIIASPSGFRAGELSEARFIYNDFGVERAEPGLGPTFSRGRPFGDVGRNTLVGPQLANVDFALIKTTKLTEKLSLQVRGEFFNLFNHPSRGVPNFIVENAGGHGFADPGEVDAAPRRIRLGLKLIF